MTPALLKLVETVLEHGWWVPLETYLANSPGETKEAVYSRRSKGIWKDGIHSKFVKGGGLWINLLAVNEWVAKSGLRRGSLSDETPPAAPSGSASPSCSAAPSAANESTSSPPRRTSGMP